MTHNFYVGDLGFHKVVNDDHPYERATAPFRKEQFDNSGTVGDQSLSGWWTRGQLSFHRGEGTTYYEVLEGEEVLNTCRYSEGVELFKKPGEVAVGPRERQISGSSGTQPRKIAGTSFGALAYCTYDLKAFYVTDSSTTATEITGFTGTAPTVHSVTPWLSTGLMACTWSATDGLGRLQKIVSTGGGTPGDVLATAPTRLLGAWTAKGRIWVLTWTGSLYTIPYIPAATVDLSLETPVAELDVEWENEYATHLTAGPAEVYICTGGHKIYRLSIAEDGSIPVLTAPAAVAEFAQDETVLAIRYTIGHLVISTTAGIRIAERLADGGIVYGPLLIEGTGGTSIGVTGTSAWVTQSRDAEDDYVLYEIDLSNPSPANPLLFPYRTAVSKFDSAPVESGTIETGRGVVWFDVGGSVFQFYDDGSKYTSATIVTGFHRMGTLDGKHFQSVTVRTGGEGLVYVYRLDDVDEDVVTGGTLLDSYDATVGARTIPLGLTEPVEKVSLKFMLYGAAGNLVAPTLLGYQLKALPSPVRQRLIRVPLMMFDIERGPTGRAVGKEKDAWTRYQALEALEESDALVTFEDKDTGETGTAYIESVELVQRNGSQGRSRSNGFGGIVSLTLRKVA